MLNGRIEEQLQLAREALSNVRRTQHVELLRLALRSEDYAVREQARARRDACHRTCAGGVLPAAAAGGGRVPVAKGVALVEAMQAHAKQLEAGERKSTLSILARAGSATALAQ